MARSFGDLIDETKKKRAAEDPARRAMAETIYQEALTFSDSRFRKMQMDVYKLILTYKEEQMKEDELKSATASAEEEQDLPSITRGRADVSNAPRPTYIPQAPVQPPVPQGYPAVIPQRAFLQRPPQQQFRFQGSTEYYGTDPTQFCATEYQYPISFEGGSSFTTLIPPGRLGGSATATYTPTAAASGAAAAVQSSASATATTTAAPSTTCAPSAQAPSALSVPSPFTQLSNLPDSQAIPSPAGLQVPTVRSSTPTCQAPPTPSTADPVLASRSTMSTPTPPDILKAAAATAGVPTDVSPLNTSFAANWTSLGFAPSPISPNPFPVTCDSTSTTPSTASGLVTVASLITSSITTVATDPVVTSSDSDGTGGTE